MPRPDDSRDPEQPGVEPEETRPDGTEPHEDELTADALDRARAQVLRHTVLRKTLRHERALQRRKQNAWSYLGTFGLIGWTVALPTLAGLAFGLFLDNVIETERSFTITFLVVGAAVGCLAAWYWIKQESRPDD